MTEAFAALLDEAEDLTFIDVGARWGVNPRWVAAAGKAAMICFEPDAEECARLARDAPRNVRYLPYGLADRTGPQTLHITKEPACSSIHRPVRRLFEHYPVLSIIEPVRTVEIECRPFDEVAHLEGIGPVTLMKLDTQGSELAILRGAPEALKTCALVDVEVEFNPLYEGQGLFCDVDRFLRDQGFVLWRVENLVHYAPEHLHAARSHVVVANDPEGHAVEIAGGQLFWAQTQYVRAEYPVTSDMMISRADGIRAALVAGLYGFWDLAIEITRKVPAADLHEMLKAQLAQPAA